MKIYLRDIKPEIIGAWKHWFKDCSDVDISLGDIFTGAPAVDAIVSPANSFGFMDGGIDLIYALHFGWDLQQRLRKKLNEEFDGELPVGEAVVVPTNKQDIPWCISAPTMRVPMLVGGTPNAYLAFRAVLRAVRQWNTTPQVPDAYAQKDRTAINSVLCPGLGTAVGRMSPDQCARQMFYAYTICHKGEKQKINSLADAWNLHNDMTTYSPGRPTFGQERSP